MEIYYRRWQLQNTQTVLTLFWPFMIFFLSYLFFVLLTEATNEAWKQRSEKVNHKKMKKVFQQIRRQKSFEEVLAKIKIWLRTELLLSTNVLLDIKPSVKLVKSSHSYFLRIKKKNVCHVLDQSQSLNR
jgi:hypothetical protein